MTPAVVVFYLTSWLLVKAAQTTVLTLSSSSRQPTGFVSVKVGDEVTLPCFYQSDVAVRFYWYKQCFRQKPRRISTFFKYNANITFHNEFKNNPRFQLNSGNGKNDLRITNAHILDSATYYCMTGYSYNTEFIEVVTVSVTGSDSIIPAVVHQSVSETMQTGSSVTLNCTVQTGTCDGEHSVYWFKDSEESHPGIIYTHGDRNDQCERKPNAQTHTCVYNLPMNNLNLSHAGTYYCAVASCGHMLFGNGTKLEFRDSENPHVLVYFLSGALIFITILVVLLTFLLYKKTCCQSTELQPRFSPSSTMNSEIYQGDRLHYAALNANLPKRSRRQRNDLMSECVYSGVK